MVFEKYLRFFYLLTGEANNNTNTFPYHIDQLLFIMVQRRVLFIKGSPNTSSQNVLQSLGAIKPLNSAPAVHKYSKTLNIGTTQRQVNHRP